MVLEDNGSGIIEEIIKKELCEKHITPRNFGSIRII